MKFHEILTKPEYDISKNWNFTRNPLFPLQSVELKNRERSSYMKLNPWTDRQRRDYMLTL